VTQTRPTRCFCVSFDTLCLGLQCAAEVAEDQEDYTLDEDNPRLRQRCSLFPAFQPDPERQEESRDASIPRRGRERERDGGMKLEKGKNILSEGEMN